MQRFIDLFGGKVPSTRLFLVSIFFPNQLVKKKAKRREKNCRSTRSGSPPRLGLEIR
uniref:Uncharacterized protein n=1 Tax=Brassica oleracea TaxID=3712 RepID=A0A3P6CSD6_BRAOL|nr:unnamed protein product [Brassica oleracea]